MRVQTSALPHLFAVDAEGRLPGEVGLYFSQFAEDLALWHFLSGRWNGFYVDVGAHDPYRFSNTFLLHRFRHWRGINVDLDDRAIQAFAAARPGDANVHAALSRTRDERLNVTRYTESAVNTADPKMAAQLGDTYPVHDRYETESRTLADVLAQYAPGQHVDLLSVDVEGLEHEVLLGNDWSTCTPDFVLVERHDFELMRASEDDVFRLLASQRYELVSHLVITSLYRRSDR